MKYFFLQVYCFICFWILWLLIYLSFYGAKVDGQKPQLLGCRNWGFSTGPDCGLNGIDCQPFSNNWTAFRCPTGCNADPSLEVIGSGPYRADSRICRAAIHAGVIGLNGGCARYRFVGESYAYMASDKNGVASSEFMSWFPKSIEFQDASSVLCTDLSYVVLGIGFLMLLCLGLFECPPLFLWETLLIIGYWYVAYIGAAPESAVNYEYIFINGSANIFIVAAVGYSLYWVAPVHTFAIWKKWNRKQRMIFWSLYLFAYSIILQLALLAKIPGFNFDLGGYTELPTTPMTYVLYTILGIAGFGAAIWHLKAIYGIKLHFSFLSGYVAGICCLLIAWSFFPSYTIHIHHVTLGAVLLPIFRFPNKVSAVCQAVCAGLLIQGYTAWGWDPVFEAKPVRMKLPRAYSPVAVAESIAATSATISWNASTNVVGYALMLNGVEVARQSQLSFNLTNLRPNTTYFLTLSAIGNYGVDGYQSEMQNFTTKLV